MKRLIGAVGLSIVVLCGCYGLKIQSGTTALAPDFSGQMISNQRFYKQNLAGANFSNAKLEGVIFDQTSLVGANFTGAVISNTLFNEVNLNQVKFNNSTLTLVQLKGIGSGLTIQNSSFDGARLNVITGLADLLNNNQTLATGVSFRGANFQNISFANIKLVDKYNFTGAVFEGSGISFESAEFGAEAIFAQAQFNGEPFVPAFNNNDLFPAGAYYGAQKGLSFFNVRVNGTDFSNAIFRYVNLNNMQLIDINLNRAIFIGCKIMSSLILGDLSCTNFSNCLIKGNLFSNNNLINSLNVIKYQASELNNSNLLDYIDHDPDGQISTNVFPAGVTYGRPAGLTRFDCQPPQIPIS